MKKYFIYKIVSDLLINPIQQKRDKWIQKFNYRYL